MENLCLVFDLKTRTTGSPFAGAEGRLFRRLFQAQNMSRPNQSTNRKSEETQNPKPELKLEVQCSGLGCWADTQT